MISNNSNKGHHGTPVGVWFKSSLSHPNGNECVEVFFDTGKVHVRDSKDHGAGPSITVSAEHWQPFLDEVVGRAAANPAIRIHVETTGAAALHSRKGVVLSYTAGEWAAFVDGARRGEFDLPNTETLAA
ncbi:DUF397 domain-containing protein [Saccharopolyspora sp. TS4A08]|uniref:DUF397 domain-containing protein n=1 Tax=Saccharopolyspora ipomoeae TaxID=3042027 RepID=A0ABT6PJM0_9PSEU|nr:DUF397 domain-containing protein [Saccharopolyspora sp. TS4A08]MDI2028201.1 DUF397 domain-containing protein [Saccharopolyspora sp. TS4A08]